ncbi:MAG TPA: ATP-binding cassette domain-containing protein [Candidatus Microbacterium pullistercoris]|nr:ATP-binding cassette domain-containing protein [Candidatus Microbacterium pullistercoris]
MPVIVLDHLTFAWPDGSVALDDVSGTLRDARTGLVGRNGSGKSTLLKLIAGELSPTSGAALVDDAAARVAYLPQRLTLDTRARVASLLGVATPLDAVRAIAVGDVAPERFDEVGDDWDVEARSHAALAEAGLDPSVLDRRVGELSGGEGMLAALTGIRLAAASVTLLDEPTNNLDGDARQRVYDMVRSWRGTLVIVSHDLDLLELMDATAELHGHQLTVFGGPYSEWRAAVDAEQEAARQDLTDAKKVLAKEKRQRIELETKIARRNRQGKKKAETLPTIVANAYARRAEESAGRLRIEARGKEGSAQAARDEADARIRSDDSVVFDLPDPGVAAGRRILTLGDGDRQWIVQGPERVALVGPNGAGKTSLLRALLGIGDASAGAGLGELATTDPEPETATRAGEPDPESDTVRNAGWWHCVAASELHTDRVAYLPQRLEAMDDAESAIDALQRAAPHIPDRELRNRLARFLIRGETAHRPIGDLSGGERFRVSIARLLLADPPSQLLVLDEPTNNLDVDTAEQLLAALRAYRGAVLIVSHDAAFLRRLAPDLTLELRDGVLEELPPAAE